MGISILIVVSAVFLFIGLCGLCGVLILALKKCISGSEAAALSKQCPDCLGTGIAQSGGNGMLGPYDCSLCGGRKTI